MTAPHPTQITISIPHKYTIFGIQDGVARLVQEMFSLMRLTLNMFGYSTSGRVLSEMVLQVAPPAPHTTARELHTSDFAGTPLNIAAALPLPSPLPLQ